MNVNNSSCIVLIQIKVNNCHNYIFCFYCSRKKGFFYAFFLLSSSFTCEQFCVCMHFVRLANCMINKNCLNGKQWPWVLFMACVYRYDDEDEEQWWWRSRWWWRKICNSLWPLDKRLYFVCVFKALLKHYIIAINKVKGSFFCLSILDNQILILNARRRGRRWRRGREREKKRDEITLWCKIGATGKRMISFLQIIQSSFASCFFFILIIFFFTHPLE